MAIYHFSAQVIGRAAGRSSTAAAAYRAGVEILDQRTGVIHDYTKRVGVEAAFILAPDSAPAWVADRVMLWNAVERREKRKDAQLTRALQLALPHELDAVQRRVLIEGYVMGQFISDGMVADVALRSADSAGDARNHHAHVLLTMRRLDPEGFGPKVREWDKRGRLIKWREAWRDHVNQALALAGRSERVDHRRLDVQQQEAEKQGEREKAVALDRAPEPKLGYVATADLRRAVRDQIEPTTDRAEQWVQVREENKQRRSLLTLLAHLKQEPSGTE